MEFSYLQILSQNQLIERDSKLQKRAILAAILALPI